MNHSLACRRLAALPLALAAAHAAPSLAQSTSLQETTVTATRSATRADDLVSDVRVIGRAAIEASSARTLTELLARTAGVQAASNGGRGKTSNIFIRGAENRHTILLVDGVRYGSATAGTPGWETIPVELIERIEVLKGPGSALYGSEGVGGVVQVFTRKGREGFHPFASATVGSLQHWSTSAGFTGGQGPLKYALSTQVLREKGFNATRPSISPASNYNPDLDPFRQDSLNASLSYDLAPGWSVDAGVLQSEGRSWYDDGPVVDSHSALRATVAQAGVKGTLLPGWRSELRLAQSRDTSNTLRATFSGAFATEQTQWSWQNNVDTPVGVALAGLELREQRIQSTTAYTVNSRSIQSAFAGINGSSGRHSWQANLRSDHNSQFGGADTWFAGYGLRLTDVWRVHLSQGTSFVAPSFNQLYFPGFGNALLQPEHGRNTDWGISWKEGGQEVKLVRFDNRIRGFQTNTTLPVNVPRARIEGWTLGYAGSIGKTGLRADFERLEPRNEVTGQLLPRRGRTQVVLAADHALGSWRLGGSLLHVGRRFDDAANTRPLGAYTTLDLHADWQVLPALTLQARLNNLADKQYETARGYNQPGRAFYLTARWQPK